MVTCTVNWRLTGAAIQLRSYHGFEAPVTLGSPTRACCQDGWTTWLVHERIAEQRHQPVTELLAIWPTISITADEPTSRWAPTRSRHSSASSRAAMPVESLGRRT